MVSDELKERDERIAELEKQCAEWKHYFNQAQEIALDISVDYAARILGLEAERDRAIAKCDDLRRNQLALMEQRDRAQAEAAALLRLLSESYRVDGRLAPDYEDGWNDAVTAISKLAAALAPAGKALLEEMERLRAAEAVADAWWAFHLTVQAHRRLRELYDETDPGVKLLWGAVSNANIAFNNATWAYVELVEKERGAT